MTPFEIGLASIVMITLLLYLSMPVAVALASVSFVGVWLIRDNFDVATRMLGIAANESISEYVFGVVPLFVLMGLFVSVSGIGTEAFQAANRVFGRVRGGLGVATVAANAVFAAVTGISIASAAVFTKIAVPEMLRLGYDRRLAVGIVAASSILGMLIPPSLLLIVYAILAEQSVADLFFAAIVPGALMAMAFGMGIVAIALRHPALVGQAVERGALVPWRRVPRLLAPVILLVLIVLGGIYGGVFTPTEAGAVGALAALLLALARRRLDRSAIWRVLVETGHVTASICLLIIAASMYSRMLALSGVPNAVGDWFISAGFDYVVMLALYLLLIILMGMILDSISIMLIVVPLALPIFLSYGADPIWFGIITVVAVEIGIITPPLGIGVFVVKGALADSGITLGDIFVGAAPFVAIMMLVLAILAAQPGLSLWLVP